MAFTIAPLLLHSDAVPAAARDALKAGLYGPPEQRNAELHSAARLLYAGTDIECDDARELVGLAPGGGCDCD